MQEYNDELIDGHYNHRSSFDMKKYLEFYKKIKINDLPDYVPKFVRGATDMSKIWLRKGMDYAERVWVLAHEIAHIANPFERNENVIDYYAPAFVPAAQNILQKGDREFMIGPYRIPRI